MSFPQWRTQFRLQHALVLLADRTPVTTTALACGWSKSARSSRRSGARRGDPGKFYGEACLDPALDSCLRFRRSRRGSRG